MTFLNQREERNRQIVELFCKEELPPHKPTQKVCFDKLVSSWKNQIDKVSIRHKEEGSATEGKRPSSKY